MTPSSANLAFQVRQAHQAAVLAGPGISLPLLDFPWVPLVLTRCIHVLLLLQAANNAKTNQDAKKSKLVVAECFADQGPILKRFRCRAQGR
jgi:hypothetical protein